MMRSSPPPQRPTWALRAYDQRTVAVLVLIGMAALSLCWLLAGGATGGLVDLDERASHPAEFRVDINAAGWPELAQLPGIGEKLARRIVESRERDGPFSSADDLRRVFGMGPKTLAKVRPYVLPIAAIAAPASAGDHAAAR